MVMRCRVEGCGWTARGTLHSAFTHRSKRHRGLKGHVYMPQGPGEPRVLSRAEVRLARQQLRAARGARHRAKKKQQREQVGRGVAGPVGGLVGGWVGREVAG